LREVVHLLGADPEKSLPVDFMETLQPRLFPAKNSTPSASF
jgi:hypothetical protein